VILGIAQIRQFEPKEWLHSFDFTCRKSNWLSHV